MKNLGAGTAVTACPGLGATARQPLQFAAFVARSAF